MAANIPRIHIRMKTDKIRVLWKYEDVSGVGLQKYIVISNKRPEKVMKMRKIDWLSKSC